MSRLVRPVLFSQCFPVSASEFDAANLIEPFLNADTKLFIDPLLLSSSSHEIIRSKALDLLKEKFGNIIRLVAASTEFGDKAWRTASKMLDLSERPETGLGYGGASTSGNSRPNAIKQQILETIKEIIQLGERDPQIISMLGIFEEGVGPDTISDLTTNAILPVLCSITQDFCTQRNIRTQIFPRYGSYKLPANPFRSDRPVILVPRDIVRELPLAADWSDVSRVVMQIEEIRDAFNKFLGPLTEATLAERKRALRRAAFQSLEIFKELFRTILESSDSYDPNIDILNFYAIRQILNSDLSKFSGKISAPVSQTKNELLRVVREIVYNFKYMVENNNLWELLWYNGKPKRERAAQLLFFAVSDAFCKANNIDISPETHSGGGPVDFKFSSGYDSRVLVEIKRSTGSVEHGYKKQLEIYKMASRTDAGIFVVIDVGNLGRKLESIQNLRNCLQSQGLPASDIVLIDATPKISASKS